ncbi:MAG: putative response regulator [Bacteroidetes bacterium HLUCCA01]|nr:MAG: putative response regulator [Bacteroidetes bacterium HLUCCA01]
MSQPTNAFWREVMDFLPGLTLLFRIDEQEIAHLMFVTDAIRNELGFAPEEYVLASEDPGTVVSADLDRLIETIAQLSHGNEISSSPACSLTDRTGQKVSYVFDFRLFRTKSARHNLISVTLFPQGTIADKSTSSSAEPQAEDTLFVAESPIFKDVLERIDMLSKQEHHVLIRGERSVGKKVLAEKLARKAAVLKGNQQVWMLDVREHNDSSPKSARLFAGIDPDDPQDSILDDIDKDLQLVIIEIGAMRLADQKDLLNLVARRQQAGRSTRIVATSSESMEELVHQGKVDAAMLYRMSFMSVFIPPLRERTEDVLAAGLQYAGRLSRALGGAMPLVSENVLRKILSGGLPRNFATLFDAVRAVLLGGTGSATSAGMKGGIGGKGVAGDAFFVVGSPQSFDLVAADYLRTVLKYTEGKVYGSDGAAALLKMKPTTLQSKLKKLGVR